MSTAKEIGDEMVLSANFGITKREAIATATMLVVLNYAGQSLSAAQIADISVQCTDALLRRLSTTSP